MFVYRFLTSILFWLICPFLFIRFKGKERKERFGRVKHGFDRCIWIHAASMGEVNAVKTLVNELLNRFPNRDLVFSTMTDTGQEAARKISPKLTTFYLPLDFDRLMNRIFKKYNPEMIILVETEFWPNMLYRARKNKVPIIIVNARLSDKSFPKYRFSRLIWKSVWKPIIAVNAQSEKDAQRFESLKFNNVTNTHNLKFCVQQPEFDRKKLRLELGYDEKDYIIVWGSSRPGEEKLLLSILPALKAKIDNLKMVIVPRHLHRLPELKSLCKDRKYALYTDLQNDPDLLIVNEMGILNTFYALADLAIVGGSFFNFGGHNPLEPAFYGIPIIIGNYHQSCRDSVDRLLENAGIVVSNKKELSADILKIALDRKSAAEMGINAKRTLELNSDSLQKNLEILAKYIKQ